MGLSISGISLQAFEPDAEYQAKLDSMEDHCPGSVDSYKFTFLSVKEFIENNAGNILGKNSISFNDLDEQQKVDLAIGFQSDFNGWLDHSRPRYGEDGCKEISQGEAYEEIEIKGLAHPGLMESQWRLLEKEGVDLEPIRRASEKFLQMWQYFIDNKGSF